MLSGGEKDITPPILMKLSKSFDDETKEINKVVLTFNERIIENNFLQNFYSSPPLEVLDYQIKSNSIEIVFKEIDNKRYWLVMNKCVKDLNEGNVLDELNYKLFENSNDSSYSYKVQLINSLTGLPDKIIGFFYMKKKLMTQLFLMDPQKAASLKLTMKDTLHLCQILIKVYLIWSLSQEVIIFMMMEI